MKKTIRLTERDLTRLIKRIVKENEESMGGDMFGDKGMGGDINRVMDFAYEMMNNYAPDGPRNKRQYQKGIEQLEHEFNYTIRNLRGNIDV